jgi:hypothetical protein
MAKILSWLLCIVLGISIGCVLSEKFPTGKNKVDHILCYEDSTITIQKLNDTLCIYYSKGDSIKCIWSTDGKKWNQPIIVHKKN